MTNNHAILSPEGLLNPRTFNPRQSSSSVLATPSPLRQTYTAAAYDDMSVIVSPKASRLHHIVTAAMSEQGVEEVDYTVDGKDFAHLDVNDDVFAMNSMADSENNTQSFTHHDAAESPDRAVTAPTSLESSPFNPRADRLNQGATSRNAQGLFPPNNTIFVANLVQGKVNDELKAACQHTFDIYGKCYVSVRRDRQGNPFALVTFEDSQAAVNAVALTSHTLIFGRPVRVEFARAERGVILTKLDGGHIVEGEARYILEQWGALECLGRLSARDTERYQVNDGFYARYAYYLDSRDALKAFHTDNDTVWQLLSVPNAYDLASSSNAQSCQSQNLMIQPELYTNHVFIGGLPLDVQEYEVQNSLAACGTITSLRIIRNSAKKHASYFAFASFETVEEAYVATQTTIFIRGIPVRVQFKTERPSHRKPRGRRIQSATVPMTIPAFPYGFPFPFVGYTYHFAYQYPQDMSHDYDPADQETSSQERWNQEYSTREHIYGVHRNQGYSNQDHTLNNAQHMTELTTTPDRAAEPRGHVPETPFSIRRLLPAGIFTPTPPHLARPRGPMIYFPPFPTT